MNNPITQAIEEISLSVVLNKDPTVDKCLVSALAALRAVEAGELPPLLTDERLRAIHHEDQFGLFCDFDEFHQIARAVEAEVRTAIASAVGKAGGQVPQDEVAESIKVIRGIMEFIRLHAAGATGFDPAMAEKRVNARLDKIAAALAGAPEAPAQAKPDRTGMTYYKNKDCKAASADDPDCICWTRVSEAPAQAAPPTQPEAAPAVAQVPRLSRDDQRMALWEAMNRAEKIGHRHDDKLVVKELLDAGFCIVRSSAAPEAPAGGKPFLTEDEMCALQHCMNTLYEIEQRRVLRSDESHVQDYRSATIADAARMAAYAHKRAMPVFSRLMRAEAPAQAALPAQSWDDAKQAELNDWFLSLPEGRQRVLVQDKWMLAAAAFDAGKAEPPTEPEAAPSASEVERSHAEYLCKQIDAIRKDVRVVLKQYNDPYAAIDLMAHRIKDAALNQSREQP